MNETICLRFRGAIKQYLRAIREKERANPFLMWTETDVQSYLYHRLVSDANFSDYVIVNRLVLSKIERVREYKGKARSVKPFYQPDFLITPPGNLVIEQRNDKPHAERRLALIRKDDTIVIEAKFARDTNDSTGTVFEITSRGYAPYLAEESDSLTFPG